LRSITQYEQYRGVLAGIYVALTENRQARQALVQLDGSDDPETRKERLRLYNQNVILHRDMAATFRTAEALLKPGEVEIIHTEAELLAEECLASPSGLASAPVYRRPEPNYLQRFKKLTDDRVQWEVELENPRRHVAGGIADTHAEARLAAEEALDQERRDRPDP
jgi:hypothetical protein